MAVSKSLASIAVAAVGVAWGYEANIFAALYHRQNNLHDDQRQIRKSTSKDGHGREAHAKGMRVSKKEYAVPKTAPQLDGLQCFETLVMH